MSFRNWLQHFRSTLALGRGQRNHRAPGSLRAAVRRPSLEVLDDRVAPVFLSPVNFAAGAAPHAVVTADFNHDGRLDLAVANVDSNSVGILLGNGDGAFQPARTFATGSGPVSLAVGDFNGDGKLDLATANVVDDSVSLLVGNGDGTLQAPVSIAHGFSSPQSVEVGDFNGDGKMDIAFTSNEYGIMGFDYYDNPSYGYEGYAIALIGQGDGNFTGPIVTDLGVGFHTSAVAADLDGSGEAVFAAINSEQGTISVALGNGNLGLLYIGDLDASYPSAIAAGDVDRDGHIDLVTGNSSYVGVFRNDGGWFQQGQYFDASGYPTSVILGDFTGDGHVDIATANYDPSDVSLLRGRGDGMFSPPSNYAAGTKPWAVAAGDFNGDGFLDLAVTDYGSGSVSVLLNDGIRGGPPPVPSLRINDVSVSEGNTGSVNAIFTVTLSTASSRPVTVHYATADGTASAGNDFTAASGDVTFAPGQTSKTISVAVRGDRLAEPTETFVVNLSAATNATIADGQGIGTILDNEPRISISDVSKKEGKKNQTTQFIFTVTLSVAYDQPVTMSFRTVNGTAKTGDDDYVAKTGTITFNPGETMKTITIVVNGDNKRESDEVFYLDLSGNSGNSLFTKNRGVGTILNDD